MATSVRKEIVIQKLSIKEMSVWIEGDSPFIMNRFDEKEKQKMVEKQMKKTSKAKEARDPEAEVQRSLYYLDDKKTKIGFPADGVKACMVRGAKMLGMVMSDSRSAFFVEGIYSERDNRDLVPVFGTVEGREDVVRIGMEKSMVRFRGQVKIGWKMNIKIRYNSSLISDDQLVNMLEAGGFGCGLGEWRPERNGTFGRYHISTSGGVETKTKTSRPKK